MKDKDAVSVMVLSMFFGTQKYEIDNEYTIVLHASYSSRTIVTVVELLAAVCLVRGGHLKVIEAVDTFKREFNEQRRFESLLRYFMDHKTVSTEFQLACMNFINVVVHSAEDVNFRVHLQHEFTELGLDEYLQVRKEGGRWINNIILFFLF